MGSGFSNEYLTQQNTVKKNAALTYNGQSVNENVAAAFALRIAREGASDILSGLAPGALQRFRRIAIHNILMTDPQQHNASLLGLQGITGDQLQYENEADRLHLTVGIVRSAYFGFYAVSQSLSLSWGVRLLAQFRLQSKKEKESDFVITPYMNRLDTKLGEANCHHSIIKYIAEPLWKSIAQVLPRLDHRLVALQRNERYWRKRKTQEMRKDEEQEGEQ